MSFKVGQKFNNFIITKYLPIDEIKVELIELTHTKLGTQVIKILNDDDENLFSLSFKTHPKDSCGAPHILEHTVLCGSKKFPVKDPFFSMLRRSLNTFMNAMTGSDFTCYPAASLVEKDFYNLLEVYLDAVFHPNLDKMSFLQEGHRFEFSSPQDASSNLTYKGVVFNEMKGSMASPDSLLIQKMSENLFPDLPYAYNSGGDPKYIPDLTYDALKEFHKMFYHPSRCLFFFYGNLDLEKQLEFIEKNALQNVEKKSPIANIPKQKRFTESKSAEDRYPISGHDSIDNKAIISFGYLTCSIENQIDLHALAILDNILMGTDGSVLKLALLKSNLCTQVDSYFDTEMSEAPYIIVCKGCDNKNKNSLLKIINSTLNKVIKDKIPPEIIEASLHQLEFSRTEISHDLGPYGLILFFRSALAKQHGIEPENSLVIHTLFNKLKERLSDPNYLSNLIEKYFIQNTHRVDLILHPDNHLLEEEEHLQQEKLNNIQEDLIPQEIGEIIQNTNELKAYQKKLENASLECLPKILIKDVPKKNKDYPLKIEEIKKHKIFHHDTFTNEILYVDLHFDFPSLNNDELILLSLFSSILTEVGAGSRNYIQNLEYIQAYTGGIGSYLALNIQAKDYNNFIPSIGIRVKSLYRNSDKLFSLLKDTITNPVLSDSSRIKEILLQQYTFLENSIVRNSMRYATTLSQSSFTKPAYLSSLWHGFTYLERLRILVKDIDKNLPKLINELNNLKTKIFCIDSANLIISSCEKKYGNLKKNNFYDFLDIGLKSSEPFEKNISVKKLDSQAHMISSPVAFTAQSYKTIGFIHENAPYLLLASFIFENNILHKKIREEGGAYGSGASYSPTTGIIIFSSFRDPHISSTLQAFKLAVEEISLGHFTDEDLNEAKLGVIQHTDVPLSPGGRAITAYTWYRSGKTKEMRQKFRDKILNATKKDIINATKAHLQDQIEENAIVTFCSKELYDKEKLNFQVIS